MRKEENNQMAKKIMIKGAIVSNNDYPVYEWLDIEVTSPKIVHDHLAVLMVNL